MSDIGLLISMLEDGTQSSILAGDMLSYHGAIKENQLLFCDETIFDNPIVATASAGDTRANQEERTAVRAGGGEE